MRFSPEEIEGKEFLVVLRGYDKGEVDSFLRAVAADYRSLQEQLAAMQPAPVTVAADEFTQLGDHVAGVLRAAADSATSMVNEARVVVGQMSETTRARIIEACRLQAELEAGVATLEALAGPEEMVDLRNELAEL